MGRQLFDFYMRFNSLTTFFTVQTIRVMHHIDFSSKIIYELKNTIKIKYINSYLACIAIFLQFSVKFIERTACLAKTVYHY